MACFALTLQLPFSPDSNRKKFFFLHICTAVNILPQMIINMADMHVSNVTIHQVRRLLQAEDRGSMFLEDVAT
jgi:hypothetical protein